MVSVSPFCVDIKDSGVRKYFRLYLPPTSHGKILEFEFLGVKDVCIPCNLLS